MAQAFVREPASANDVAGLSHQTGLKRDAANGDDERMMRVLVLGGPWFHGRAVVDDALSRGWGVTTFRRGRSGRDTEGISVVRGDRAVLVRKLLTARLGGSGWVALSWARMNMWQSYR